MIPEIYINSAKQISIQKPLSEEWFDEPILYNQQYIRAIDPDYKQFFTPNEVRRFGKILKRALLVSREAMNRKIPDAIITGTGLGCIENTEFFLKDLTFNGENLLKPTHFMNSTHNTISSLVAIDAHCHAYNTTYSHKGVSFENALMDAFLQLKSCKIANALVGAHDEMTPDYFTLLQRIGYLGNGNFSGETAVAMLLENMKNENSLCKIENVEIFYKNIKSFDKNFLQNIDYVMIGINGNSQNDDIYFENSIKLFPKIPLLQFKNIFGESYTSSAFGVYAAAVCLQRGRIAEHLFIDKKDFSQQKIPRNILIYNHFENKNHSFVMLSVV
ncbi:MAG: beta-ketoacyl synthase chain length factor [Paludibacter sp.]|nr:beta-ketoacyl synthase chain length factor [Paludibacter sp.]